MMEERMMKCFKIHNLFLKKK
jgi:hypothetical protein